MYLCMYIYNFYCRTSSICKKPIMNSSKTLIVQDNNTEERSCVYLSYEKMDQLLLDYGAIVLVKGRNRKESACIVMPDDTVPKKAIGMNWVIRSFLQVRVGDIVTIRVAQNLKYGKNINLMPTDDSITIRYNVFRGAP